MSQIFVLGITFCFMPKNGNFLLFFFEYFFLNFTENELGPISKF